MGPEKVEEIIQYITIRRKREALTQKGLLAPAKFPNKQETQLVKVVMVIVCIEQAGKCKVPGEMRLTETEPNPVVSNGVGLFFSLTT